MRQLFRLLCFDAQDLNYHISFVSKCLSSSFLFRPSSTHPLLHQVLLQNSLTLYSSSHHLFHFHTLRYQHDQHPRQSLTALVSSVFVFYVCLFFDLFPIPSDLDQHLRREHNHTADDRHEKHTDALSRGNNSSHEC